MFHQIESRLREFIEFVPLDFDHLSVHSLKLVTIILETGPEIINSFDLATFPTFDFFRVVVDENIENRRDQLLRKERRLKDKNRSLTFKDYHSFLGDAGNLKNAVIYIVDLEVFTKPFERVDPDWWESYNLLRHDKYNNLKKATLINALKSLSALFWLVDHNCAMIRRHEPARSDVFLIPSRMDLSLLRLDEGKGLFFPLPFSDIRTISVR